MAGTPAAVIDAMTVVGRVTPEVSVAELRALVTALDGEFALTSDLRFTEGSFSVRFHRAA